MSLLDDENTIMLGGLEHTKLTLPLIESFGFKVRLDRINQKANHEHANVYEIEVVENFVWWCRKKTLMLVPLMGYSGYWHEYALPYNTTHQFAVHCYVGGTEVLSGFVSTVGELNKICVEYLNKKLI